MKTIRKYDSYTTRVLAKPETEECRLFCVETPLMMVTEQMNENEELQVAGFHSTDHDMILNGNCLKQPQHYSSNPGSCFRSHGTVNCIKGQLQSPIIRKWQLGISLGTATLLLLPTLLGPPPLLALRRGLCCCTIGEARAGSGICYCQALITFYVFDGKPS